MSVETAPPPVEVAPERPRAEPRWRGVLRRRAPAAAGFAVIAALPLLFPDTGPRDFVLFVGQYALVYAMVGLSVVVITGYAGLISLMPYSFAGIGAIVTGLAMASWGWPFWLAAPLAAVATVPVSVLVGVASARLKGLYLAIATLTLADALGETFFKWEDVTGPGGGWLIARPTLGPIGFASELSFYLLCIAAVALLIWMVEGLRTSRLGRAMVAVRDNEQEAQAVGINVYKTKLVALTIGGMVAGVGGAFLAELLLTPSASAFRAPQVHIYSLLIVTLVAVGGIDRALGAFFGALVFVVQQQVFAAASFFFAFVSIYSALVLIVLLKFRPGGLVEIGRRQLEVIRRRPAFGIGVAAAVIGANVALAWLFIALSE